MERDKVSKRRALPSLQKIDETPKTSLRILLNSQLESKVSLEHDVIQKVVFNLGYHDYTWEKNAFAKKTAKKVRQNIPDVVSKLSSQFSPGIQSCHNVISQKKTHAETRGTSFSPRSSTQTPAPNTKKQLNTILWGGKKKTHWETCDTRSGSGVLFEKQLVISGKSWAPFVLSLKCRKAE